MRIDTENYSSMAELVDACNAPNRAPEKCQLSRKQSAYWQEFSRTSSYEEAVNLALEGWPEGLALANAMRAHISAKVNAGLPTRPVLRRDVAGAGVDVGAYCAGQPDCMYDFETEPAQGLITRILLNVTPSCGIASDVILARGAAVVALVDALETCGRRCEVSIALAASQVSGPDWRWQATTLLKAADQPADLDKLAFGLSHPSVYRRLALSRMESMSLEYQKAFHVGHGNGYPCDIPHDKETVYLGRMMHGENFWQDAARAVKWVLDTLRKQGVDVEEQSS